MVTDQEIEATLKKTEELDRQLQELIKEAQDPAKNMDLLLEQFDGERERLVELLRNTPEGAGDACIEAVGETVVDWIDLEVAAAQGLAESGGGAAEKSRGANRPPRRGMRI